MSVQFIEIAGQQMAVLPADDFRRLAALAEDVEDTTFAAEADRRLQSGEEEYVPSHVVDDLIAGVNPLKVYRKYRGLTGAQLGEIVGATAASISRIESGTQNPTAAMWRKLAEALNVNVDDIMPWPEIEQVNE